MTLAEVRVEADRDKNVASTQMGVEKLDIKTIRQVPTALGEADVLRVLLTLPGVKSVGEGSTGLNVRGGSADQNLILFNGATVYNPSHLFGFFSAFNPDVVDNVELVQGRHSGPVRRAALVGARHQLPRRQWAEAQGRRRHRPAYQPVDAGRPDWQRQDNVLSRRAHNLLRLGAAPAAAEGVQQQRGLVLRS